MRGWSFRLAERLAAARATARAAGDAGPGPALLYANLAARGATTREIVEQQLARAVAMRPDLATLFSGTNDVLRPRFDAAAFAAHVLALQRGLREAGATVLTFTLPDLSSLIPFARPIAPRIRAMNDAVRAACAETGTRLIDFAVLPLATDARFWNDDRIHANAAGHERIAAALAQELGLPGTDGRWREPLPAGRPPGLAAAAWREIRWSARHLLPWTLAPFRGPSRALAGRRPTLEPFPGTANP
jgi:lysophospholipase L1-like esterase